MRPPRRHLLDAAPLRSTVRLAALVVALVGLCGCHAWHPPTYAPPAMPFAAAPIPQTNPLVVNSMDRDYVWDQVVDVVDDYFRIQHEERVRLVGDLLTEGHLETYPRGSSTILEPWNTDSVTFYERWEATLQSMRRRAEVRVLPTPEGFQVEVLVFKELEDVPRPESGAISLANSATLRNDDALIRVTNPLGGSEPTIGWIGVGRDVALEQTILAGVQARLGGMIVPVQYQPTELKVEEVPPGQMPTEDLPAPPPQ